MNNMYKPLKSYIMKKRFFLAFFLAVLVLFVVMGCKETIVGPIPPIVKKYTVETISNANGIINPSGKTEVISGKNFDLTITPNPGFKVGLIKVNDIEVVLIGNTYSLTNVNNDYKIEVTFKKTLSWYAMQGAWSKDSVIIKENDGTWTHHLSSVKDSVFFLPTGRYNIYDSGGTKIIGDGDWSISESTTPATFNFGGFIWRIEELNDVSLILATDDFKDVYSHH